MSQCIDVAVLGGSGYIGIEVLQRLSIHPNVNVAFFSSETHVGEYPCFLFPPLRNSEVFKRKTYRSFKDMPKVDLIISALPAGVLPAIINDVFAKTSNIINIAGDFRLDSFAEITKYYPKTLDLIGKVDSKYVFPEFDKDLNSSILNMPGCMASAVIYALYPLAKNNMLDNEIIVDAKTGSTGGGIRDADSHAIRSNNIKTHKLFGHRHAPEIRNYLSKFSANSLVVRMTTTSVDIPRGVLVHVHGQHKETIENNEITKLYLNTYKNCPFINFLSSKKGRERFPSVKSVIGTNFCEVFITAEDDGLHFVATAALDNLVKGGAGNAIQAMNLKYGFEINNGLQGFGIWP
jgi:LysW-gamma-L-alpha-aminoadipyl-6-phosphate/LysW-L-glutamyl-5-phosphate reductase